MYRAVIKSPTHDRPYQILLYDMQAIMAWATNILRGCPPNTPCHIFEIVDRPVKTLYLKSPTPAAEFPDSKSQGASLDGKPGEPR